MKTDTASFGLLSLMLTFLAACTTNAGGYTSSDAVRQKLMTMTKSEIAMKLGAPTQRVDIAENQEAWTYESALISVFGGQCKISISFDGSVVANAVVNSFDYSPVAVPMGSCAQIIRALD